VLLSFLCTGAAIALVVCVPQAQPALYLGILLLLWCVTYLARVLPVGSSGLRVAIWTLGPLFAGPLDDPAGFEQRALVSAAGVSVGVLLSHAAAALIFPGAESLRARQAVDALLVDASTKLRALADRCRDGRPGRTDLAPDDADALAHIGVLSSAIQTYAEPRAGFPELVPLTRIACISDSASVHLEGLAREAHGDARALEAAAAVAMRLAELFDRLRGLSFERHWARSGDRVPELEALAVEAEGVIAEGDRIVRASSATTDDATLAIAGFARRVGGSLRASLTDRPLPPHFAATALALPIGFAPANPTGRAPTLTAALATFNPTAAIGAAAAVSGLGLSMLLAALFLPTETSPAAIGAIFVMQSTIGGSGRRGLLRFIGTVIGGAMAIVAMGLFAGGLQHLGWFVAIMGILSFVSAWVFVGSPRTSYVGLMMAAAWIPAIAVDAQPAASVVPSLARVGSVILAGLSVTFMIWLFATTSARAALMRSIAEGWRRIGSLASGARMLPVTDGALDAWRRESELVTGTLATTADLREAYTFERRMIGGAFQPVLRVLAEQQRALLLARALAVGRFHDHPLPLAATAALDAALEGQARRLEGLAARFTRPESDAPAVIPLPAPRETRAAAVAAGCSEEDVARLMYRRDAIGMLGETVDRAERLVELGFVWVDGELESVLEEDANRPDDPGRAAMLAATS
jgi:hypothetical protein